LEISQIQEDIKQINEETAQLVAGVSTKMNRVSAVQVLFFPLVVIVMLSQFLVLLQTSYRNSNELANQRPPLMIDIEVTKNHHHLPQHADSFPAVPVQTIQEHPRHHSEAEIILDGDHKNAVVACEVSEGYTKCESLASVPDRGLSLDQPALPPASTTGVSLSDYYYHSVFALLLGFIWFGTKTQPKKAPSLEALGVQRFRAPSISSYEDSESEFETAAGPSAVEEIPIDEEKSTTLEEKQLTSAEKKHDQDSAATSGSIAF
jgi:hypothetical protein